MNRSLNIFLSLAAGALLLWSCGNTESKEEPEPTPVVQYDKLSAVLATAKSQAQTVTKNLDIYVTNKTLTNAFIEDSSAGAIIRCENHGLQSGYEFKGDITITYQLGDYNPEYTGEKKEVIITKLDVSKAEKVQKSITLGNHQLSDANADFRNYTGKKVRFKGSNIVSGLEGKELGEKGIISQGSDFAVLLSTGDKPTMVETGKTGDVIGYLAYCDGEQTLLIFGSQYWVERELPAEESAFTAINTIGVYNLANESNPVALMQAGNKVQYSARKNSAGDRTYHITSITANNDFSIKFTTSKISCGALYFADLTVYQPVQGFEGGSCNLVCAKRTDDLIWLKDSEHKIGAIVPNK